MHVVIFQLLDIEIYIFNTLRDKLICDIVLVTLVSIFDIVMLIFSWDCSSASEFDGVYLSMFQVPAEAAQYVPLFVPGGHTAVPAEYRRGGMDRHWNRHLP